MAFPSPLVPVYVEQRLNRFGVAARQAEDGRPRYLHLPNSGRMLELLVPGALGLAWLTEPRGNRTEGRLLLVRHGSIWVGVDAHLPNRLVAAALASRELAPFAGYATWRPEVPLAGERLDFLLTGPQGQLWLEVKSCNRVDGDTALFPDAPTARGTRHLEVLAHTLRPGVRAAVVWVVQRSDARRLRPFAEADPDFAGAVHAAAQAGVELYAYGCRVTPEAIILDGALPVEAGPG